MKTISKKMEKVVAKVAGIQMSTTVEVKTEKGEWVAISGDFGNDLAQAVILAKMHNGRVISYPKG